MQGPPDEQVQAGLIAKECIVLARRLCQNATRGEIIDKEVEAYIRDAGGQPALKGYQPHFSNKPYEHTVCLSLNNEVVHGPPLHPEVTPEDIITIDLVVNYKGWHADTARTFTYSNNTKRKNWVNSAHTIFIVGLQMIRPNIEIKRFGQGIESLVQSSKNSFTIIKEFCGHGIGQTVHDEPQIINYFDPTYTGIFAHNKTYAIEPILAEKPYQLQLMEDEWTYRADCLTTHFEDTIWVGETKVINLTA